MKIFYYKDYEEYKSIQTTTNKSKINRIWVTNFTITEILKRHKTPINNILCHGTRNGAEQELFLINCKKQVKILGTEISDTAIDFPNTIQWDFMEPKEEWKNKFDIVYSNSFDHCIKPHKTIKIWLGQINPINGVLYIDYYFGNKSSKSDPLYITENEMDKLIFDVGGVVVEKFKGKACFRKTDNLFEKNLNGMETKIYAIKNQ